MKAPPGRPVVPDACTGLPVGALADSSPSAPQLQLQLDGSEASARRAACYHRVGRRRLHVVATTDDLSTLAPGSLTELELDLRGPDPAEAVATLGPLAHGSKLRIQCGEGRPIVPATTLLPRADRVAEIDGACAGVRVTKHDYGSAGTRWSVELRSTSGEDVKALGRFLSTRTADVSVAAGATAFAAELSSTKLTQLSVRCSAADARVDLGALSSLTSLDSLSLSGPCVLASAGVASKLRSLRWYAGDGPIALDGLQSLTELQELSVTATKIAGARALERLPQLATLWIEGALAESIDGSKLRRLSTLSTRGPLPDFVEDLPALGRLSLSDACQEVVSASLTELSCSLSSPVDLRGAPKLESLQLALGPSLPAGQELASIANVKKLRSLSFATRRSNRVSLAALAGLGSLERLNLGDGCYSDFGAVTELPALTFLSAPRPPDAPPSKRGRLSITTTGQDTCPAPTLAQ